MGDFWGPENAGMLWGATMIAALAAFVFWVFLQWKVFTKAGFSGALALVNFAIFIPLVGAFIVLGLYTWFAFAKWPALNRPQS